MPAQPVMSALPEGGRQDDFFGFALFPADSLALFFAALGKPGRLL